MNTPTRRAGPERIDASKLRPGLAVRQYELLRKLGHGSMGQVFLARDVRLGRRVAIKFLSEDSFSWADRFRAEARAIARCRHENIVVVHDIKETTNGAYMVLEYIDGPTLREWLDDWRRNGLVEGESASERNVSLPVLQTLEVILPVVRAVAHAHHQGVVHRDLKPENIMLASDGSVKVLDFGIAKLMEPSAYADTSHGSRDVPEEFPAQTQTEVVVGTLAYMSPEHWGSKDVDARSDLWSLGIILWEMLTGRHPLEPLPRKLSFAHMLRPIPSITKFRSDLGPLADTIDSCLRLQKTERIASAEVLLEQLEPILLEKQHESRQSSVEVDGNPYAGLAAFQETDAHRFFGRERDVDRVMGQLHHRRLISVVGPSGTGKSSFVRAGVIANLKRLGTPWKSYTIRPGREPLLALGEVLANIDDADRSIDLHDQPGYLGVALRRESRRAGVRILLFVDQFEELYTLGASRPTREAFIRSLDGAADDVTSPVRVILTLRSDFLDRVTEDRAFSNELIQGMVLLSAMTRDDLRRALTAPLDASGIRFENETMVEAALDALNLTHSPLPLLQFTMSKLWDLRDQDRQLITQASYTDLGGVEGALASHADAVLAGLSRSDRQLVRLILTQLVTEEGTRAVLSTRELRALVPDGMGDAVEHLVQVLAQARLLSMQTDDTRGTLVELSHESLIERWPQLRQWREEGQEEVRFRSQLRNAAQRWQQRGRATDMLWQGALVAEAERWQQIWQDSRLDIGRVDQQFLRAVLAHDQRVRRRRIHAFMAAFGFVTVVAVGVSILAYYAQRAATLADAQAQYAQEKVREAKVQAQEAMKQAIRARNATRMATARENQDDPTLVLALIRDIEPAHPPPRWRELARWALQEGVADRVFEYPEPVLSVDLSHDGTRIAAAVAAPTAYVQALDDDAPTVLLDGHKDYVWDAAFSPSGRRMATVSGDRKIRVWDLSTKKSSMTFHGHQDRVIQIVFSADERWLATASLDKTARLWPVDGSSEPIVLDGHQDAVTSVGFSPDGQHVVTSSWDGTVRLWNRNGPPAVKVFRPHKDRISFVAFDPTGQRLVTTSWDKTARVWPIDESQAPVILRGHTNAVGAAAFSLDGRRIVTGSDDRTVRVWNADGTGGARVFRGHVDAISRVFFHPDGRRVLSASIDGTVRTWAFDKDYRTITLRGHLGNVTSASFSPDGTQVVTASADKTARVWAANGEGTAVVLRGHLDQLTSAVFSPDGQRVVTASADKTARIWDTKGRLLTVLKGHDDRVWSAAFSPDGQRVVTASWDKTVRVWSVHRDADPQIFSGHLDRIWSASFSPDGTRVVSASEDKTALVWSVEERASPLVLRGHAGHIYSTSFSPDGTRILTAATDKTVRLWDSTTGEVLQVLTGHESIVLAGTFAGYGAFSPDGRRVATISYDQTIRIWSLEGTVASLIMQGPHMSPYSASFSPDGTRIVTASHAVSAPGADATQAREGQAAKIWRIIELASGLQDPLLWQATAYCPSVEKRIALLSVSKPLAEKHYAACVEHVDRHRSRR